MSALFKQKSSGTCAAFGCDMRMGTNLLSKVRLFKFPRNPERRKQWEVAVNRKDFKAKNSSQLCNLHFISGQPSRDPLHPDYIPSIFSHKTGASDKGQSSVDRYDRHAKRLKVDESLSEANNVPDVSENNPELPVTNRDMTNVLKDSSTMTELSMEDIKDIEEKNKVFNNRLQKLSEETVSSKIMGNIKMFDFYTKLPDLTFFNGLLTLLMFNWTPTTKTVLEPAEQLLAVLMKLRLGLLNEDIAYRFGVGAGTISMLFREWLARMAFVLSSYIRQPSKKTVKRNLPKCFREAELKDVTCVVDCSEIFIDRPFNLNARAQTYSNYKHHNTVKFLIACTPAGGISYISKAYGGRLSDKELTKESGFLDIIKENDVILADRGFRIEELVALRNARVIVPSSTKGKKQLPAVEIMRSRQIARVRVHIERAIGRMKTYRILKHQWPITYLNDRRIIVNGKCSTADNILKVIAALCNISRNALLKDHKSL